jgi:hypothetical protein
MARAVGQRFPKTNDMKPQLRSTTRRRRLLCHGSGAWRSKTLLRSRPNACIWANGEKARGPCTVHTPTQRVRGNPAAALAAWRCPWQRAARPLSSRLQLQCACPKVAARRTSSDLQKQVGIGRAQARQARRPCPPVQGRAVSSLQLNAACRPASMDVRRVASLPKRKGDGSRCLRRMERMR